MPSFESDVLDLAGDGARLDVDAQAWFEVTGFGGDGGTLSVVVVGAAEPTGAGICGAANSGSAWSSCSAWDGVGTALIGLVSWFDDSESQAASRTAKAIKIEARSLFGIDRKEADGEAGSIWE